MSSSTNGEAPAISVVIPVRNAPDDLARCLETLARQSVDPAAFEVLVLDDGSDDATPDVGQRLGARVIRQQRLGAAAARNRGVREARGEIVLFLDADCEADPRWIEEISHPLREKSGVEGAVGKYDTTQSALVARFVQLEIEARYERMQARDRIDFLNSGNCAFRRQTLLNYPFDESFHRLEDVELSFRLAQDGHAMIFVPTASVCHRHPRTVAGLLRRKFNYARYAMPLYRRYPVKAIVDSSTPQERRARLVLLAAAVVTAPGALIHPMFGWVALAALAGSIALSFGVIVRAFRQSPRFGFAAVGLVALGNLAFLAGVARGILTGRAPEANPA
ncbi:MAG: glycosyltransferase [Candidatus Eiseniibacteriota bacterium]